MIGDSPETDARPVDAGAPSTLLIRVVPGIGAGPTQLAAFDAALVAAGAADRNLIRLSSVIPAGAVVESVGERIEAPGSWGDRLYVVLAEARSSQLHDRLAAGIGWVQEESTGRGLFVEHEGHSLDEVETHIRDSLDAMSRSRDVEFGPVQIQLADTVCEGAAACALVIATFESASWRHGPPEFIEI